MSCTCAPRRSHFSPRRRLSRQRNGVILVLTALLMVVLVGMLAFAIDLGYIATVRTELRRASDAGVLAGAGLLVEGTAAAKAETIEFLQRNSVGNRTIDAQDVQVEFGHWNEDARSFSPSNVLPSAIRVTVNHPDQPLFFARVFGMNDFSTESQSVAVFQPRDMMLVLDYSASMNDDSELRHISTIGQGNVEANLLQIYNELGAPVFGDMQWDPVHISHSNSTSSIKNQLGLSSVAYPYPSGSWDDYIRYVQRGYSVRNAGYRDDYGYLTLVNYWLERRPKANQTPDLWMTSEQPITAVKDAVTLFLAYLQEVETEDRLGLSVYTADEGTAVLESGLTLDFQTVEDISRRRQAGHYDYYTNIGAGMRTAIQELEQNSRPGAKKMMVLMTDGIANRPSGSSNARQYALDQAMLAASDKYPIVTISLGSGADTDLMQQIADITGGIHFNIPGGQSVQQYEEDLKEVFRKIADDRPLMLVQ